MRPLVYVRTGLNAPIAGVLIEPLIGNNIQNPLLLVKDL